MTLDTIVDERIAQAIDALRRDPPPPRIALGLEEAGAAVGTSAKTVERWVNEGLLPTVPHTKRVLIPVVALEAFVSSGSTGSDDPLSGSGSPVPLRPRRGRDRGADSTARGDTTPPAA